MKNELRYKTKARSKSRIKGSVIDGVSWIVWLYALRFNDANVGKEQEIWNLSEVQVDWIEHHQRRSRRLTCNPGGLSEWPDIEDLQASVISLVFKLSSNGRRRRVIKAPTDVSRGVSPRFKCELICDWFILDSKRQKAQSGMDLIQKWLKKVDPIRLRSDSITTLLGGCNWEINLPQFPSVVEMLASLPGRHAIIACASSNYLISK